MCYFIFMFEGLFVVLLIFSGLISFLYFRLKIQVDLNANYQKDLLKNQISDLASTKELLLKEKDALHEKERQHFADEIALRDKIWSRHESDVVSVLSDLSRSQDFLFNFYTNNSLPPDFNGDFKPDFLLELNGQYLIFDAKSSRSSNLESYLYDQVKKTATKLVNADEDFVKEVYFVIPDIALSEVKRFRYYEKGYNFFVVNVSSLSPVFFLYKKIIGYNLASIMSSDDKDKEITVLADYYQSMNFTRATQFVLSEILKKQMSKIDDLPDQYLKDLKVKTSKSRVIAINSSDIKKNMKK